MTMSKAEKEMIERFLSYTIMFELFKMGWEEAIKHCWALKENDSGGYVISGYDIEEAFSKKMNELDGKIQVTFEDDDGEPQ